MRINGPGVYPLDPVRECPGCDGTGGKHWGPDRSCKPCEGTGQIGREDGPKVEILHLPGERAGWNRGFGSGDWAAKVLRLDLSVPFATTMYFANTPALAYAAAVRAYEEGKR